MSLYKRPRSPYYWSKLYHDGDVVYFSTRKRTKVEALQVERERAKEIEQRKVVEGRFTVATLAAKFIVWKEADGRAESTVSKITEHLQLQIIPFLGAERDARTIDVRDLEAYKSKRMTEVGPGTVAKELSSLRQLLRYGAEVHKLVERAPTTRNPKSGKYTPKWKLLSPEQVTRIIDHLAAHRRGRGYEALPWFLLMANTGMRGGELARVTWDMVNREGTAILLPAPVTKTRRARTVPLNELARAAVHMMRRGETQTGRIFSSRTHYGSWRAACAAAKVRARPHDLRHTFGSLLHAAGRSGPEIRDILGHVTMHMANLYAHTYEEKLHEAVASVQLGGSVTASVTLAGISPSKSVTFADSDTVETTSEKKNKTVH